MGNFSETDVSCKVCVAKQACRNSSQIRKDEVSLEERRDGFPSWCPMVTEHIVELEDAVVTPKA
jgi:hypothetical protein